MPLLTSLAMNQPTMKMIIAPINIGKKALTLVAKAFHAPVTTVIISMVHHACPRSVSRKSGGKGMFPVAAYFGPEAGR
jgi:hypothetical protein